MEESKSVRNVSAARLAQWLEEHTDLLWRKKFKTNHGYWTAQAARTANNNGILVSEITGAFTDQAGRISQTETRLAEWVIFALDDQRSEVTTRCLDGGPIREYVDSVTQDIERLWPAEHKAELLPGHAIPNPPKSRRLDDWFDYYHAMHAAGRKMILKDIAKKTSYSLGYVKQEHAAYNGERNPEPNT